MGMKKTSLYIDISIDRAGGAGSRAGNHEGGVVTAKLLDRLVTTAPPKDREIEAAKAKARSEKTLRGLSFRLSRRKL